jgi:hypothetical protein
MAAIAAAPDCPAHGVTHLRKVVRRGCPMVLRPMSTRMGGDISDRGWHREFDDPIILPDGGVLLTLLDAGEYIQELSRKEQTALRMA